MRAAAQILRRNATEYGRLMAQEMGKPLRQGVAEVEKCAFGCDFFAEHAAQVLADEFVRTEARKSFVAFRPLGVILAVMPWNYPFWQVLSLAAPASWRAMPPFCSTPPTFQAAPWRLRRSSARRASRRTSTAICCCKAGTSKP